MSPTDIARLQRYLQGLFANPSIDVRARPNKADSAEVFIGDEFIGVLFRDEDDPEDYHLNMSILGVDLEDVGGTA
ncbi:DUF3126 family protein [Parvularcula dongshanensis]|uniref:DUF3126 family protein n=1 Tax=Parvularcula dongshanensis TaxID=1173995 RepID=A0A840I4C6_9PROT|nr:DUF3126 family protein [Parvularcula dongshanensis]MBB4659131.1 hypothetical protein [Parvularcula dongshanensis]